MIGDFVADLLLGDLDLFLAFVKFVALLVDGVLALVELPFAFNLLLTAFARLLFEGFYLFDLFFFDFKFGFPKDPLFFY